MKKPHIIRDDYIEHDRLMDKAYQLIDEGKDEEAAETVKEALKYEILVGDYILLGSLYLDLEKYQQAEELYNTLIEENHEAAGYYGLGRLNETLGRKMEAIKYFEKSVSYDEINDFSYSSLYNLYDEISNENKEDVNGPNSKKAIYYGKLACEADHGIWDYFNVGYTLERLGQDTEALEYFLKAYEINPKAEHLYYCLGVVYGKLEMYDKAIEFYNKEIETGNPSKSTYYNLGVLYKDLGDLNNSKLYYLKAIQADKEDYNAWYNLSCDYAMENDFKNAYDCLKYIKIKNDKYLNLLDTDEELIEFRKTKYYQDLKDL